MTSPALTIERSASASGTPGGGTTSTQDGLCRVCHAAPRYRRNAQTCRALECRRKWVKKRQAENSHAYRLRQIESVGVLVEDPALLVELGERARRAVFQNPMTPGNPVTPENPMTPLYGYDSTKPIVLNSKNNTIGQVTTPNRYSSASSLSHQGKTGQVSGVNGLGLEAYTSPSPEAYPHQIRKTGDEYSTARNLSHQDRDAPRPVAYPDQINHRLLIQGDLDHPLIQGEIVPDPSKSVFTLLRARGKLDAAPRGETTIVPDASHCRTEYAPDVPDGCVCYQVRQGIVDYGSVLVEGRTVVDLLSNLRPYLWRLVAGCLDDSPQLLRLFRHVAWVKEQPIFLALQPPDVALIREAAIVLDREATRVKSGGSSQILRGMPLDHVTVYLEAAAILRRAALAKKCGSVFGVSDPGYCLAPGLTLVQSLLTEFEPEPVRAEDAAVSVPDSQPAQTPDEPSQSPVVATFTTFGPVMRRPDLGISPGPESMLRYSRAVGPGIAARASPELLLMPTGPP